MKTDKTTRKALRIGRDKSPGDSHAPQRGIEGAQRSHLNTSENEGLMYMNCHTHVFNFTAVSSPRTFHIIIHRVVKDMLKWMKKRGELPQPELHFGSLFYFIRNKLNNSIILQQLLAEAEAHRTERIEELLTLIIDMTIQILMQTVPALNKDTVRKYLPSHYREFLSVFFSSNISEVAKYVLGQDEKPHAIIALMMDISGNCLDFGQFKRQLRDTSDLVLRYPGFVFPFVAVNTNRTGHYSLMRKAITEMGFVGVKLYPSLGYPVQHDHHMDKVLDFCSMNSVPIMVHCTSEGFSNLGDEDESEPRQWADHLKRCSEAHRPLKICFAHFGGAQNLIDPQNSDDKLGREWPEAICTLMQEYSNVYADLSYHTEAICDNGLSSVYLQKLSDMCARECHVGTVGDRVLFGSDTIMLAMDAFESDYVRYFKTLPGNLFEQFAYRNARLFLGLDDPNNTTITGYKRFLESNGKKVPQWMDNP